jgi:hypothetical protein
MPITPQLKGQRPQSIALNRQASTSFQYILLRHLGAFAEKNRAVISDGKRKTV